MDEKIILGSGSEIAAKRLVKLAADTVRRIDAATSAAQKVEDHYTPELLTLRMKLRRLCVTFLDTCPSNARRKAEELLWRKVLYEVVAATKSFLKEKPLTSSEKYLLENHLNFGNSVLLDYLIVTMKRAKEENVSLPSLNLLAVNNFITKTDGAKEDLNVKGSPDELRDSIQRVFLWLGDLARYRADFDLNANSALSLHYYQQAVILNPQDGLPLNQIGTLFSSSRELFSVFYYMKSSMASKGFQGAETNLRKTLERPSTSQEPLKNLVQAFKELAGKLFYRKQADSADLGVLCGKVLGLMQNLLNSPEENVIFDSHDILLAATGIVILCELNSKSKTSPQSSACVAFAFSLFSHITLYMLKKLEHLIPAVPVELTTTVATNAKENEENEDDEDEELGRARLRRRKLSSDSGSSQSDSSDFEISGSESGSETESDSDSDSESTAASLELQLKELSEFPADVQQLLGPLELLCALLKHREDTIPTAGASAREIWSNFARLLNTLALFRRDLTEEAWTKPSEEDWLFYGVKAFEERWAKVDFSSKEKVSKRDEFLRRVCRVVSFGDWLTTIKETEMEKRKDFYVVPLPEEKEAATKEKKEKLMHNMAHLWLKSEVQELERKLEGPSRRRKSELSLPYVFVVPDVAVLARYPHLLKQIVRHKKCIVVVPTVVISELDELKKESAAARDSIRWLEDSFRTGDRFVRAQRSTEQSTIPLLTYPKRKDKELWSVFQIAECCNYLNQQHSGSYKGSGSSSSAVLFLTGNTLGGDGKDQSLTGICSAIGVDVKEAKTLLDNRRKSSGRKRN